MARVVYTEELIRKFYEEVSKEYPEYPMATIDKIVRAEFRMVKDKMTNGELEDIRLQYLFKLTVSPQRVMKQLRFMTLKEVGMSLSKRQYYMELLLNHVKKNKKKFKKYEGRIKKYTGYTRKQIDRGEYLSDGHSSPTKSTRT